ncbi:unnamed protein product (mitochondrion) [Plasmodiophora brassicae]|uniref:Uncharacterized protein n=1 Tax=Plasmodiophora brassicae TaxID=37360 RepID=A0A3P3YEW4_PLABS|nr:unnamed protein product [Plasmodiophora brassicae]
MSRIVRSFDKARSRGFSLTSLPPEILMTLHPFRNGVQLDELSPTQKSEHDLRLFEVGSAVQRSIQRELPKGYVAIASPGQRRQTDRRGSPGVLGALGLAHVDFTESVTLKALLRDSDFGPAWTHRLLESSLYHQLDALFGTGHTDDAHQLFDLVETLNVWAPVDDIVAADPLALSSRAKEARPCRISTKCNEFSVKRQTVSQVVGESGPWFWRPHMRFGEAFVFDSRRTPHAAVKLCHPTSQSAYRNSIEVRVLILRYRPMISSHPGALVTAYLRYHSKTRFYTSRMRCSEAVFEFDQRLRRLRGSTDGSELT